jgi:hypothetical protein
LARTGYARCHALFDGCEVLLKMWPLKCRCFPPGTRAKSAFDQSQIERAPFFWRHYVRSFTVPKMLNSSKDAQAKSMSTFEIDEHLQILIASLLTTRIKSRKLLTAKVDNLLG